MAKLIRLLSVGLLSATFLMAAGPAPATAQNACTETFIVLTPSPDVQTYPIPCDACPAGVTNWVIVGRGHVVVYSCHFR